MEAPWSARTTATSRVVGPLPPPVVRGVDVDITCEVGIEQTREDSLVDLVVTLVRGHDRRQPLDVAVIDDLVELLPRPGGSVLGSQVIEHEQRGAANLIEAVVVGDAPRRVEGSAQVVKEIGHDREVDAPVALPDLQRRGDREVGLANTDATAQVEPAMLGVRVTGERAGDVEGLFRSRNQFEVLKCMAREPVEVREAAKLVVPTVCLLGRLTFAFEQPAEIGVSNGNLHAHPACILADGTTPRWSRRRRAIAAGRTDWNGEGRKDVADAFHRVSRCPALPVPLARFPARGLPTF